MKNKQKVWIRGVEGRGEEVLNALKALGGKMKLNSANTGDVSFVIYTIDHNGYIGGAEITSETAKIIMDCYREIKLSEQWKDGTVLFSPSHRTFAVYTEEDNPLSYVPTRFVLSDNEIEYNCCIRKRDYRIANKKDRKIFLKWLHELGYDFDFKTKEVKKWRWKPKEGETYWIVNNRGFANSVTWHVDIFDELRFNFGNCFRTKEEAEVASERIRIALKGGEK